MGLKADIEEVQAHWSRASWWFRAWLILSGFLAISSIAALAEHIAKWKGFFRDAIIFYHDWIALPLTALVQPLGIRLEPLAADMLLLLLLVQAAWVRGLIIATEWNNRFDRIATLFGVSLQICAFAFVLYQLDGAHIESIGWKTLSLWAICFIVIPILLRTKAVLIYFAQLTICLSAVGILAAINSGLSK